MKLLYLLLLLFFSTIQSFGQLSSKFSQTAVEEDLKYLRQSLKETHHNLYAYTSEQEFDSVYLSLKSSLDRDSFSLLETISTYQRLISIVNNGHTEIDFPGQSYGGYAYEGGTLFPLEIAFENNKPLVRKNWSAAKSIAVGSEVLSINGMGMNDILSRIYPQISAERRYFKNAKIEMYSFPRYYWQVFGKQDNFEVKIRANGSIKTYSIKAINLIEGYETKRDEVLNAQMELKFFKNSAYLNPGSFSGDEQKYQHFIDSAFTDIKKNNCKTLIIDLRNNAGGDNTFSDYLVSYFANKPFNWNSKFTLKTSELLKNHARQYSDTTDTYWQKILTHENGEIYDFEFDTYQPQAKQKRFNGKIYVLINRQSHSQSVVTAAQIKDYKLGTLVGEETGDYPSLYASQFQYSLPNTGIPVKVAKGYIVRVNGSTEARRLVPDIFIKDYLLDEKDEILNGLLEILNGKTNKE